MDNINITTSRGTIRLRLRLSDFMARVIGVSEMSLDAPPGATLTDILRFLEERMGPEYKGSLLESGGTIQPGVIVSHRGRIVTRGRIDRTFVNDRDDIKIMISAQGG